MDKEQISEGIGGTVKRAKKETVVAVVLFFVGLWVVLVAGMTAVWLTEEVRVFTLVMLPAGIVAALLVVYFDWRARLLKQIRDEHRQYRKAA
jgi:hypothetical protein